MIVYIKIFYLKLYLKNFEKIKYFINIFITSSYGNIKYFFNYNKFDIRILLI